MIALLVLPGAALGFALRLRATVLWGAAPALTLGMVGAAAIGYAKVGLPWNPSTVLAGMAVACAVVGGLTWAVRSCLSGPRSRIRRSWIQRAPGQAVDDAPQWSRRARIAVAAVGLAAGLISVVTVLSATRGLEAVPQGWDSLLHGFATRWIAQHEVASPFMLADVAHPADPHYYYPDAFHALTALSLQLPGASMPAAYNAMVVAIGPAFILGSMALVRQIDPRPTAVAVAALLAASVGTYPMLMDHHGPLSPFALSVALIPGIAALAGALLRRAAAANTPVAAIALGIAFSGMYVTHPSAALAGVIVLFLVGFAWVWRLVRERPRGREVRGAATAASAGIVGAVVVAAVVTWPSVDLRATAAMSDFDWPAVETPLGALGSVLSFPLSAGRQWALTALLALGFAAAFRNRWARGRPDSDGRGRDSRLRPFVAAVVVFGALYVVTASSDAQWVQRVTAPWWNDKYRFLGLMGAVSVPVLTAGTMLLLDAARWLSVRWTPARPEPARHAGRLASLQRPRTVAVAGVVILAVVSAGVWAPRFAGVLRGSMYSGGPAVTAGEQEAYRWLAGAYEGGTVMNDPFDGSPWLYTLEKVPVVMPGALGADPESAMGAERMALYADLHSYGSSGAVDAAVAHFDVRWVLVGEGSVNEREKPPGFSGLGADPGLRVAYETPAATIYRVLRR